MDKINKPRKYKEIIHNIILLKICYKVFLNNAKFLVII